MPAPREFLGKWTRIFIQRLAYLQANSGIDYEKKGRNFDRK